MFKTIIYILNQRNIFNKCKLEIFHSLQDFFMTTEISRNPLKNGAFEVPKTVVNKLICQSHREETLQHGEGLCFLPTGMRESAIPWPALMNPILPIEDTNI